MDPAANELLEWMKRFEAEQKKINRLVETNFRAVRWEGIIIGFFIGAAVSALVFT